MKENTIYNLDCLCGLKKMSDNSIDLVVTSPPYDNIRKYNGYLFDFKNIAKELYKKIKQGGILVWVVGDQTVKGSETGTSFKQALYFKEVGFNLHDTMIYEKTQVAFQREKTGIDTHRYLNICLYSVRENLRLLI